MRVTSGMYYRNLYGNENSKLTNKLFDVNKQIASGLKIQYASDDVTVFTETMRLDNEVTTLDQVKKSTENGLKFSDQTDTVMNEFNTLMNRFRTLLVQAANDTNDEVSRDAISKELRGIEENLKGVANTSINGNYIFSGSATDVKPINDDGTYNGNGLSMNAFVGSNNQQQYNISGEELFLGEEASIKREITTNVVNTNLINSSELTSSSEIRELMGDKYNSSSETSYFYLRGMRSDGTSFKDKFTLNATNDIQSLLNKIESVYGNGIVQVSFDNGEIVVQDKLKGSSKLDFHLVGATDFSGGTDADVDDIDDLTTRGGETIYPPTNDLYVKEFVKSSLVTASGSSSLEASIYDRTEFSKSGSLLTSNVSQVLKSINNTTVPYEVLTKNAFATPSTKISDVADTSQGTAATLDGTKFDLNGTDTIGNTYNITINLDSAGSTFVDNNTGISYDIYNMETPRVAVDADKMTYQQLMDVVDMAVTGSIPPATFTSATDYDNAIKNANAKGTVSLTYDGKLQFQDLQNAQTQATIAMYDNNSDDFTADASVMTFNTNNALTIRDPKTDFFKEIDTMIKAVENYSNYPDATIAGDPRNIGIQGAIAKMDDLQDHIFRSHSTVGAQSNTLSKSAERVDILQITTMSLRSSVIDTDLAEASLTLTQLNTNYQAMLSTVGRISQLSLVNYL